MRPRKAIALLALLALAAAGCSRLTFVKPKMERGKYTRVAPEYEVREDKRDRQRIAALDAQGLAEQALRQGQLDEAERQARAAVAADASSADAHTVLAVVLQQRGDARQAGVEYARAVALAPGRGIVLNNYAVWLCDNGRPADSLPLFDRTLADSSYPTPAAAMANAGACALAAGQAARADRQLRQAIVLDPANAVALAALADSEYRAGRYLEARAFSERRLAAAPVTQEVLQLASQIEQKLGDTAAAARYVQRMRAEFPGKRAIPGDAGQ
ncbi:MAG: type IV pilus biogenesis/stability protein PilW [Lysobacter sp.]|nr:type IV pilus biogenesis/stability protein PilW [Lysobacter sp.]